MGGNFEFQAQDSFLEYFLGEIERFEKRISLTENKAPLKDYILDATQKMPPKI